MSFLIRSQQRLLSRKCFRLASSVSVSSNSNHECQVGFLGTVSAGPTRARGASSVLINWSGVSFIVDCGESTARQLGYVATTPGNINAIFITHMHGDHIFGLPTMILHINDAHMQAKQSKTESYNDNDNVIKIFGPPGIYNFVCAAMKYSRSMLSCNIQVYELMKRQVPSAQYANPNKLQKSFEVAQPPIRELQYRKITRMVIENDPNDNSSTSSWQIPPVRKPTSGEEEFMIRIKAVRIKHTIPCFGYIFEEDSFQGNIDMAKTVALGLRPGPAYKELKKGLDVTLEDGTVIKSSDVVSAGVKGRKLVILGDTSDPSSVLPHGRDCDLLVHEATMESGDRHAISVGHSTAKMAGLFAQELNAKRLALTHFSKKLDNGLVDTDATVVDWTTPVMLPPIDYVDRGSLQTAAPEGNMRRSGGAVNYGNNTASFSMAKKASHSYTTKKLVELASHHFGSSAVLAAKDFMFIPIPRGGFKK